MKRMISLLLCTAMLTCFASLCAYAAEETTEASAEESTTEEVISAQTPTHIVFNTELTGKKNLVLSTNHMAKGSGKITEINGTTGLKMIIDSTEDPHVGLDIGKFFKRFEFEPTTVEATPFIAIKLYADEILFDDIEIYYCAGDVSSPVETCKTSSDFVHDAGNGDLYFVYDLTGDAAGEYVMMRVDFLGAEEEATMYLTDFVFFATEDDALNWCGYYDQPTTEEPTTEEQATTEVTTEEKTEAESQKPAVSKPEEEGCGGVVGAGVVALALISMGAVCIKKKD